MYKGKSTCETLKSIRKQIADANDIPYEPRVCTHKGDCMGTCPACESEMRYIENQLNIRKMAGKAVKIVGLATVMSLSACNSTSRVENETDYLSGDTIVPYDNQCPYPEPPMPFSPIEQIVYSEGEDLYDDETYAEYPGGIDAMMEFFETNLYNLDTTKKDNGLDLTIVEFFIARDGSTSNVKIRKSVNPAFDKEVIRVIKMMPKWKPATYNGGEARSMITLSLNTLALTEEKSNTKKSSKCPIITDVTGLFEIDTFGEGIPPLLEGDIDEDPIFYPNEVKAEFPGGQKAMMEFLKKNIVYPMAAQEEGISGKVFVRFVVEKDGMINHIEVIKSVHPLLDKEAVRVIKRMPCWAPGKQAEHRIKSSIILPIDFRLNQ